MFNDNFATVLLFCRGKFDNFVGSRKKSSSSNIATKINNGNLNNTAINRWFYLCMVKNNFDRKSDCEECKLRQLKIKILGN